MNVSWSQMQDNMNNHIILSQDNMKIHIILGQDNMKIHIILRGYIRETLKQLRLVARETATTGGSSNSYDCWVEQQLRLVCRATTTTGGTRNSYDCSPGQEGPSMRLHYF